MPSCEDEGTRTINKFSGKTFNLWKFKLKMGLGFVEFWALWKNMRKPHFPTLILK